MTRHNLGQAARGLAAFFCALPLCHAGSFSVNPVRITLSAQQRVAAITVHNSGATASVIQLQTSLWSQHSGKDELAPSTQILATPPIFTLQPGASQIVRVGLLRAPAASRELTYRLILREVPPPQPIAQGLRVALAISMPVFVASTSTSFANLQWSAAHLPDGGVLLRAANVGNAHIQIGAVELSSVKDAAPFVRQSVATYVLPGNAHEWTLKGAAGLTTGSLVRVLAQTDEGEQRATVALGSPPAAPAAAAGR
jgi:fimbrial chaperone protein